MDRRRRNRGRPCLHRSRNAEWQTYSPADGGFSVLMPEPPEVSEQPGKLFTVTIASCEYRGARFMSVTSTLRPHNRARGG